MKKSSLADRVLNNFYLRNLCLYLAIFSISVARKTLVANFNVLGFWMSSITFGELYLLIMFHNLVLYKKFFRQRKYLLYAGSLAVILVLYNECILSVTRYFFVFAWPNASPFEEVLIYYDLIGNVYIGFGLYMAFTYFREREEKLRIENLARQLELKQLKEQLNPHFLFNALNNIYSYTLEGDRRANELILKLSELMRFIIENADRNVIPITQEIFFAECYIAFEHERLGSRCVIHFSKSVNTEDVFVAPFILFTFIENAFKHGTGSTARSEIFIELYVDDEKIMLGIRNPVNANKKTSTKTGLANARRRLDIMYPQKYSLELVEEGGNFFTELRIEMADSLTTNTV